MARDNALCDINVGRGCKAQMLGDAFEGGARRSTQPSSVEMRVAHDQGAQI
jgi:hypothetical protein